MNSAVHVYDNNGAYAAYRQLSIPGTSVRPHDLLDLDADDLHYLGLAIVRRALTGGSVMQEHASTGEFVTYWPKLRADTWTSKEALLVMRTVKTLTEVNDDRMHNKFRHFVGVSADELAMMIVECCLSAVTMGQGGRR